MGNLLEINHLSISFDTDAGEVEAVRDVSFSLKKGEILAIVGESGCGKSVLCKSIMKLLPQNARYKSGNILVNDVDITGYRDRDMQKLRGKLFSMVFQDPMTSLNPTIPIGTQIAEAIFTHEPKAKKEYVYRRVIELMKLVGIDEPEARYHLYPYNFSGGMRQRSVMAIALASSPKLLFADEPTTSLDVTIQAQILDLLREIQQKLGTATLLVSHDLGVVARVADRVAVMYAGKIVEIGTTEEIFHDPRHPYTWGLMMSLPAFAKDNEPLHTIPGMPPTLIAPPKGDAFACRNQYALDIDYLEEPPMFRISDTHFAATWLLDKRAPKIAAPVGRELRGASQSAFQSTGHIAYTEDENVPKDQILLDIKHLSHQFQLTKTTSVRAIDDISFQIKRGEILGLVGESGSGKSTIALCIMNIYKPLSGNIIYKGIDVCDPRQFNENRRMLQTTRQVIFQDSTSSLNQRMKVSDIIAEPMSIHHIPPPRGTLRAEAQFQLKYVGMDASYLDKYPPELSGGMRQRVAIARALSMEPELLIADEPIASLDVSIQAQIINLFKHLQEEHNFTFLFIAHDLSVVRYLCDRIGVMYRGKLVELADTAALFSHPLHPYTQSLLSAIPIPDPQKERERQPLTFDETTFTTHGQFSEAIPGHYVLQ